MLNFNEKKKLLPFQKRVSKEKWECPICSLQSADLEKVNHPDPIAKRARTKIVIRKSKTDAELSAPESTTPGTEHKNVRKKKSSSKEISSLPRHVNKAEELDCSPDKEHDSEQCHPVQDHLADGVDKRINAAQKTLSSKKQNLKFSEQPNEKVPEASSENNSQGDKPVVTLEASKRAERKRKPKVHFDDTAKKQKTDKDKTGSKSNNPKANAVRTGTSKSHGKNKVVVQNSRPNQADQDVVEDIVDMKPNSKVCTLPFILFSFGSTSSILFLCITAFLGIEMSA